MNLNSKENQEFRIGYRIFDNIIRLFKIVFQHTQEFSQVAIQTTVQFFRQVLNIKKGQESLIVDYERENLIESIQLAKAEWISANRNFEFAQDKDIVDYYTYQIKASEVRYQYLLRLAKENRVKLEIQDKVGYMVGGKTISS